MDKKCIILVLITAVIGLYVYSYYSRETFGNNEFGYTYHGPVTVPPIDLYNCKKYLINLKKRVDRLRVTSRLLKEKGFSNNLERFLAIEGLKIPPTELNELVTPESIQDIFNGYRTEHKGLSIGAVGCYLSHVFVWEAFKKETEGRENAANKENGGVGVGIETLTPTPMPSSTQADFCLVFEDDTLPREDIYKVQSKLIDLPPDWDIILIGGAYSVDSIGDYYNEYLTRVGRFFCTHAYLINLDCINLLLPKALPMSQQIDSWLSDLSETRIINIYGLIDNSWLQNTRINSTDIQTPMIATG